MKKLFIILCMFSLSLLHAQESELKEMKNMSLRFTVDNIDELKTINWDDVKDFFKDSDSDETITLGFKVKEKKMNSNQKLKVKYSFEIKGKPNNIDALIASSKKMIKALFDIKK